MNLLCGQPLPLAQPLDALRASLAEQIKRGGRGSDLAAAKLEGIRCASDLAAEPTTATRRTTLLNILGA